MSIVFIIQFITGIVGLSVKNDGSFPANVASIFKPSFAPNKEIFETNFFQQHFKCCGWNSYTDYSNGGVNNYSIPTSCCSASNCTEATINQNPSQLVFAIGCQDILVQTFSKVIEGACGILVAMSLINLISILLSIVLARYIKSGYQFS